MNNIYGYDKRRSNQVNSLTQLHTPRVKSSVRNSSGKCTKLTQYGGGVYED